MNADLQLQLQALLDGEMPPRRARRLAAQIAADPQAQALLAELRMTKALLAGHEAGMTVPESREFYWSKVERAILRAEQAQAPREEMPWWVAWRRWLMPATAMALVAGVTLLTAKF